jgi:CRISPR-associated endonuclease Csn1
MTATARAEVRDAIFFQRRLHPATALIGRCELERREPRCPVAHRHAQRYRMLQEVNNLRVMDAMGEELELSPDRKHSVLALLSRKEKVSFDEIRAELGLLASDHFNLEHGERGYLWGHRTDHAMRNKAVFGKRWDQMEEAERDRVVELVIEVEDPEKLKELAQIEWKLEPQQAERLAGLSLQKGYASCSLKAIDKLLPHMEAGLPLTSAEGPSAMEKAGYQRPDQRPMQALDALPKPPELRNPIVQRALHEVRKVVNGILREYGKPVAIHIELAREARGSLKQREERTAGMRKRERERAEIIDRLKSEFGIAQPSRSDIERYRLWQDFNEACPYTGRVIGRTQLFSRDVDVDHILPYSRSLDNSYANKVICFQSANAAKSNHTPFEWLGGDPVCYEAMLQRVSHLWKLGQRGKQKKFSQKTVELDDFIARQLNDTQYISREVTRYLRGLGVDVVCTKGQTTADLRWQLGLDTVLSDKEQAVKNREDHRHHAIDAIVIALTNRSMLQQLAHARSRDPVPPPWASFHGDVESAVKGIKVSHRVERKVAGALHEETIYGPTSKGKLNSKLERPWAEGWVEEAGVVVYRKRLEDLTAAMAPQIRDPRIRELVAARLQQFGIEPGSEQSIPAAAWKEPLKMPSSGVPIRKVRILKSDLTIQPIRGGSAWVKPGSVHHVCIFEVTDARGKTRREPAFVSMMEAARRVRDGEPLIGREHPRNPKAKFIMSLSRGELVLGTFRGRERLVRFRTCASTQGQLYFVEHTDARPDKTAVKFVATANSLKGRKVTVDPLGRIRWAND